MDLRKLGRGDQRRTQADSRVQKMGKMGKEIEEITSARIAPAKYRQRISERVKASWSEKCGRKPWSHMVLKAGDCTWKQNPTDI